MHGRDGMDKIMFEAKRIWKIINDNKKVSIGVVIVLIILFELIVVGYTTNNDKIIRIMMLIHTLHIQ